MEKISEFIYAAIEKVCTIVSTLINIKCLPIDNEIYIKKNLDKNLYQIISAKTFFSLQLKL